jgi:hypothetical protein
VPSSWEPRLVVLRRGPLHERNRKPSAALSTSDTHSARVVLEAVRIYESHIAAFTHAVPSRCDPKTISDLQQLQLTQPELFFCMVFAEAYGASLAELAAFAVEPRTSTAVEIDGVPYAPRTALAHILLASLDDPRFREAPVQEIVTRLQDFLLRPLDPESLRAWSTGS